MMSIASPGNPLPLPQQTYYPHYRAPSAPYYTYHREPLMYDPLIMAAGPQAPTPPHLSPHARQDAAVAQALEIARESPDGAQDPTVSKILEQALSEIWSKVQAQPSSYVMSRDEFAVFNFFQYRFVGNNTAILARKRFWDNCHA
ncbi:hypothetical protein S40285_01310 [Stachybotrys chlorohalonatus IBT 40285]|uniref:Uncharacterized protein n=1 Tax=Stachybotrys chlorohalonatus (strain IBT 40285) TaxID=1283841 RepID=A0A084QR00_STAC4|nr:hypothetical protein S40285_01310 [Stachybotrys chlorohalonata IBT 40285]